MIFVIPATKLLRVVRLNAAAVARPIAGLVTIERQNLIPGAN